MNDVQEEILRALIAAQVATLEWSSEAVGTTPKASSDLLKCLKQATKWAKKLEDE